jgi:peptidoglycan/xylan/chitin deacetylase (PgdA/CDA1 family)
MLSWKQVKELLDCDIKIGGHTRSHLRLNEKATEEQIAYEVEGCANDIEKNLGFKPTQFCYPNGDTSSLAVQHVERTFNLAVTTQKGINNDANSAYSLRRVGLHEDASGTSDKLRAVLAKAI